jgi:hypothetical protein
MTDPHRRGGRRQRLDGLKGSAEKIGHDLEDLIARYHSLTDAICQGRLKASLGTLIGPMGSVCKGLVHDFNAAARGIEKLAATMKAAGITRIDPHDKHKRTDANEKAARSVNNMDGESDAGKNSGFTPPPAPKPAHVKGATGQSRSSVAKCKAAIAAKASAAREGDQ